VDTFFGVLAWTEKVDFQKGTFQKRRRNDKHVISLKAMPLQIYSGLVWTQKTFYPYLTRFCSQENFHIRKAFKISAH